MIIFRMKNIYLAILKNNIFNRITSISTSSHIDSQKDYIIG